MIKTIVTEIHRIECDNLEELRKALEGIQGGFRIFAQDADDRCELYDTAMISKTLEEFLVSCEDNLSPFTTLYTITLQ